MTSLVSTPHFKHYSWLSFRPRRYSSLSLSSNRNYAFHSHTLTHILPSLPLAFPSDSLAWPSTRHLTSSSAPRPCPHTRSSPCRSRGILTWNDNTLLILYVAVFHLYNLGGCACLYDLEHMNGLHVFKCRCLDSKRTTCHMQPVLIACPPPPTCTFNSSRASDRLLPHLLSFICAVAPPPPCPCHVGRSATQASSTVEA